MPARRLFGWGGRQIRRALILVGACLLTLLVVRAWDSQRGAPLEAWHILVPRELPREAIEEAGWNGYLAAEERLLREMRETVSRRLDPKDRIPLNRYFEGSPAYPAHLPRDWNRSYVLEPEGPAQGAAVFLHGLTDSPYSLRHLARRYAARGFVAIAPRLPAHGTVPGALTAVEWEDWMAATRMALREARRRAGPGAPVHLVGFSNGAALALMQALDMLEAGDPEPVARIVLVSPMVGVTAFARFARLAGLPAVFPAFAKAAWLGISPEFNPFKYNSFPVNGARQSWLLTDVLRQRLARLAREGRLGPLPPVLTFQSVMDATVSTAAVLDGLYARLPANGSELVLFDINRATRLGPLFRPASETALERLLPLPPRRYRVTVLSNRSPDEAGMAEESLAAGETAPRRQPLELDYPPDIYSLSHIALPFPVTDALYGLKPDPEEDFGIRLGDIAPRGERNTLVVDLDSLLRVSSNPFFPYLIGRVEEGIAPAPRAR